MRRFNLQRDEDTHGMSGTGVVAEGVAFSDSDGPVAMRWLGLDHTPQSVAFFYAPGMAVEDLIEVHGHAGRTRIVWLDDDLPTHP